MTFGENLKAARRASQLTQEALASLLGVTKQTVSRYESGAIQAPSPDMAEAIAAALSTTPAALFGWERGEEGAPSDDPHLRVTAQDDAMAKDRILRGDTVFVRSDVRIAQGDLVAAKIDGVTYLRRYYPDRERELLLLLSPDPAYPPMIFRGPEQAKVRILGRAVRAEIDLT